MRAGSLWIIAAVAAGCGSAPRGAGPWEGGPLAGIWRLREFPAARISSGDREGKDRARLAGLEPGAAAAIADLQGPGIIRLLWMAVSAEDFFLRKLVLRIYWDDESRPSVETPLGDFFCLGHADLADLACLPLAVSSDGGELNAFAYFPMPFRRRARIAIANEGFEPVASFAFDIDYLEVGDPEALGADVPYFHAEYRQEAPREPDTEYVVLDAQGRGQYIGCNLSIELTEPGSWGEWEERILVDRATAPPLRGLGTGSAFRHALGPGGTWSGPYAGRSIAAGSFGSSRARGDRATVYRFHLEDAIPFRRAIRVAFARAGGSDRRHNCSSVAYWYQIEPHTPFPPLPPVERRLPADARGDREYARLKATLRRARETGRLDSGIRALRSFTEEFPDYRRSPVALLKLASLWKETGRPEEALASFRALSARYPETLYGRIGRNELLLAEKGPEVLAAVQAELSPGEAKKILRAGRGGGGWAAAFSGEPAGAFFARGGERPAPFATEIWANADGSALHLRARLEEPQLYALRATVDRRDGPVWEDDAIEFLFDADRDYVRYRRIVVNARGTLWDGIGDENEAARAGLWDARAEARAERGEGAWEVYLSIPFGDGGLPRPNPGDVWGFDARRIRRAGGREEIWTWNDPGADRIPQPQRFGYLLLP